MTDLASAIAPGLAHDVIGIRPGEKLHEVMVPADDARATVEIDDRYIITPSFMRWAAEAHWEGKARKVAEDFRYGSDTNTQWLSPDDIHRMLNE